MDRETWTFHFTMLKEESCALASLCLIVVLLRLGLQTAGKQQARGGGRAPSAASTTHVHEGQ